MVIESLYAKSELAKKQYILGRKEKKTGGTLDIGRYYALDASLGAHVYLDVIRPHVILICGKRGYGKSYTIGTILEEIARLDNEIKTNLGVLILDTLGIFWTMQFPNLREDKELTHWNLKPEGFAIRLLVPKKAIAEYKQKGITVQSLSLRVSELSPYHWCRLFNVNPTDPIGVAIIKAVFHLQESQDRFSLHELLADIENDTGCDPLVKRAAENFFTMAEAWGIFERDGITVQEIVCRGALTVLDVSHLQTPVLKTIVAAVIGEKIFEERVRERKIQEQKKIGFKVEEKGMPIVWFAIDEAQLFLPSGCDAFSKDVFINGWMRQGRQPGLSLIMATQRPSALEPEVLSHCDLFICHRLTAQEDIEALSRIRPIYMQGDIAEALKKIGDEKGVVLIIDDTSESAHIIKIRPRLSWHGGAEALVLEQQETGSKRAR